MHVLRALKICEILRSARKAEEEAEQQRAAAAEAARRADLAEGKLEGYRRALQSAEERAEKLELQVSFIFP